MKSSVLITSSVLFATLLGAPQSSWAELKVDTSASRTWKISDSVSSPQVKVIGQGSDYLDLRVEIPTVQLRPGIAEALGYTQVEIEGATTRGVTGAPALPVLSRWIALPPGATASVEILRETRVQQPVDAVYPSQPMAMRCGAEKVPFTVQRAHYEAGAVFPGVLARVGSPSNVGGQSLARLDIHPLQFDAAQRSLSAASSLDLRIRFSGADSGTRAYVKQSQAMRDFLRTRVLAPKAPELRDGDDDPKISPAVDDTMLIVLGDKSYKKGLEDFIAWKEQRGLNLIVKTMKDIGKSEDDLQKAIQEIYDDKEINLAYILLVGNEDSVPTHHIPASQDLDKRGESDYLFTLLEGDDNLGDVFLGRFSASKVEDVEVQANKVIYYEKEIGTNKDEDLNWLKSAIGMASSESGSGPSDIERMEKIVGQFKDIGFEAIDTCYEGKGPDSDKVVKWLNEGRAWVAYMGHGTGVSWAFTSGWRFSLDHMKTVENPKRWPIIIDCACSNGDFWNREPSFTEAWQRAGSTKEPLGSLAMISSTILAAWDPPAVMEEAIVSAVVSEKSLTLGGAMMSGLLAMDKEFGENKVVELSKKTFNNFGDPSLVIRNDLPRPVKVEHERNDDGELEIQVSDSKDKAVKDAMVALSRDNELILAAKSDKKGVATFKLPEDLEDGALQLVVTGHNLTAFSEEFEWNAPSDDDDTTSTTGDDTTSDDPVTTEDTDTGDTDTKGKGKNKNEDDEDDEDDDNNQDEPPGKGRGCRSSLAESDSSPLTLFALAVLGVGAWRRKRRS